MDCKAAGTTCNINTFGPGTANKHIVQWWLKMVCKEGSLEDEEHSGRQSEVDTDRLKASPKLML